MHLWTACLQKVTAAAAAAAAHIHSPRPPPRSHPQAGRCASALRDRRYLRLDLASDLTHSCLHQSRVLPLWIRRHMLSSCHVLIARGTGGGGSRRRHTGSLFHLPTFSRCSPSSYPPHPHSADPKSRAAVMESTRVLLTPAAASQMLHNLTSWARRRKAAPTPAPQSPQREASAASKQGGPV